MHPEFFISLCFGRYKIYKYKMSYLLDVSPHDGAVVGDVSESGVDVERRRYALPVRSEVLHRFRMILLEGRREAKGHERISFFVFP